MIPPSKELYVRRMRLINAALVAIKDAWEEGIYSQYFSHAAQNLRLVKLETFIDYRRRLDISRGGGLFYPDQS